MSQLCGYLEWRALASSICPREETGRLADDDAARLPGRVNIAGPGQLI
jgi:hypothetical protein